MNEFIKAVSEMRQAQKDYFTKGRKFSDLEKSKNLEKKVDILIKEIESNQLKLF